MLLNKDGLLFHGIRADADDLQALEMFLVYNGSIFSKWNDDQRFPIPETDTDFLMRLGTDTLGGCTHKTLIWSSAERNQVEFIVYIPALG